MFVISVRHSGGGLELLPAGSGASDCKQGGGSAATNWQPVGAAFLLRGIVIGFSIAAPVGPIGVLCIRRTLANGRAVGLVSGLGAATADAVYGTVAGFGLTAVSAAVKGMGMAGAYASTFLLTLTNPMTILSFGAVFAGLGLTGPAANYASATMLVVGVFVGSALWWLTLSGVVGSMRRRFNLQRLRPVNRLSGIIITGFGVLALASMWLNRR